jgi:hypothetical protein
MGGRGRCAVAALMALGSVTPAVAQSDLTVGVRAGLSLSTMEFDELATDAQTEVGAGLAVDFMAERKAGRFLSFAAGVALSQEGFGSAGAHTGDLHRLMVGVPLMVKAGTPTSPEVHVTVGVAPKMALRCAQGGADLDRSVPCGDPLMGGGWDRFDVAGLGGVGVAVPAWGRVLVADVTLAWGLRDIGGSDVIPGAARAVGIGLMVGMMAPWRPGGQGGEG